MNKIKVIHDTVGHTLTVWWGDPSDEEVCEQGAEEIVFMKGKAGGVIGLEILHYRPASEGRGLVVETVMAPAP